MQVGDLVRHKNHPLFGVILEIGDDEIRCLWCDDDESWVVSWWVIPCK